MRTAAIGVLGALALVAACSAHARRLTGEGAGGAPSGAANGGGGLTHIDLGGECPSTCAALGASCGPVSDPVCGGVLQCGTCPSGQTCGGSGLHNVCGVGETPDACTPMTCEEQDITCGAAGDGCSGTLQCGTCTLPQSCGGNPAHPGQCGCTGTCALVPVCPGTTTTTLTGTVYDPAGIHPLYNALVYIPNDLSDPGLQPFVPGITCDQCGATAAGNPLVSTYTAPDGTFTLTGAPAGAAIPLVIELGRWRRQLTVNIATSCGANTVPAQTLTMPTTHAEGDIPFIGILTGAVDPVECVLRKMGIADSEFTDPGNGGHINFYLANASQAPAPLSQGAGARIDAATPAQAALFAADGGTPAIDQYDMVILECEGYPQAEAAADLAALLAYANAGGRVFASDFAYAWLYQNGSFAQALQWDVDQTNGGPLAEVGLIDLVSNPKGTAFEQWLVNVGVSAPGSGSVGTIYPTFHNSNGVVPPSQRWLYWGTGEGTPMHSTFNTPVGAPSAQQCGRVVYSDWHADSGVYAHGTTFPSGCDSGPMTAQEVILEFMLFDLTACVQPYTPVCTPNTCLGEGIACGPASDGCGNLLQCGPCPAGQFCGGGGPGQCGTASSCLPETCATQDIACGQAGDGCGNVIDCGNCPAGDICGFNAPGQCGHAQ